MKTRTWDNEEVILTDSTRPDWSYAFSPAEFKSEYNMTIDEFNKDRAASGSPFRVELVTWQTELQSY